jgi:hypothetical protein
MFTLLKYNIILNVYNKTLTVFLIDVLLTVALIKQSKFLICDSSGKFQNDLGPRFNARDCTYVNIQNKSYKIVYWYVVSIKFKFQDKSEFIYIDLFDKFN